MVGLAGPNSINADSPCLPHSTADRTPTPTHTRPLSRQTLLVGLGGTIRTTIRLLLTIWFPPVHGVPVSVFLINITGAFLLGALLETLTRTGSDTGIRRTMRLFVGTGIIGGYTPYSTLAVGVAEPLTTGQLWTAGAHGVGTVLFGAVATLAGILAAREAVPAGGVR